MSVVELHPEDLLDREAEGEISEAERDRLERHTAQCSSCRMERQVRADFRREEEPIDGELDVQRLLSEVLAPGADREAIHLPAARAARRRSAPPRWRSFLVIAAALLVGGVAAAAGWNGLIARPSSAAPRGAEPSPPTTPAVVAAKGGGASTRAAAPITIDDTSTSEQVGASARAVPSNLGVEPPAPLASTHGSAVSVAAAVRGALAPTASIGDVAPRILLPAPAADAASLFLRANAARRADDHVRAEDLYRTLLVEHPESLEANQSRALLGHMLLEDGGPSRALRYFDDYLNKGGPLAEDVMSDRASALARLGRTGEESVAWSALLERYPQSVHADRARTRLRELGAP